MKNGEAFSARKIFSSFEKKMRTQEIITANTTILPCQMIHYAQ